MAKTVIIDGIEYEPKKQPTPAIKVKVGDWVQDSDGDSGVVALVDPDGDGFHLVGNAGGWSPAAHHAHLSLDPNKRYSWVTGDIVIHRPAAQDTPFAPPAPAPAVGQVWKRKEGILSRYHYVLTRYNGSCFLFNPSTGGKWSEGGPTAMDAFSGTVGELEYVGEAADLIAKGLGK